MITFMASKRMMTNDAVLIDSDAFIGWLVEADAHHRTALQGFNELIQNQLQPIVTNLVIAETATWLSNRVDQPTARRFLEASQKFHTVFITERLHHLARELFNAQERKKTSFVDMLNIVVVRELSIPRIFAFDEVYSKTFHLPVFR